MKKVWVLAVALLLTACGSSGETPSSQAGGEASASVASAEKASGPLTALEVLALTEAAGVECNREWRQAEGFDEGPVPIFMANEVWRCGEWFNDPNRADIDDVTIATFETADEMDMFFEGHDSLGGGPDEDGEKMFVGDLWFVSAVDADKMSAVAEGEIRD